MAERSQVKLMLWSHEVDGVWQVQVNDLDLIETFPSPGAALDAADRWATARGFTLMVDGLTVTAWRGAPEQGDDQ